MTAIIDVAPDIDAYFEEIVHDAIIARKVEATEAAETYLTALLVDYAKGETSTTFDQPLTFQLRDALEARGAERFQRLQSIGDGVLYLLGFFEGWMTRHGADRRYVMGLGSTAYSHASAMMRLGGTSSYDVLQELSSKYDRFVAVLSDVAEAALKDVTLRGYQRSGWILAPNARGSTPGEDPS